MPEKKIDGDEESLSESTKNEPANGKAIDSVILKTIETRIDGVRNATHRSRFVFIVITIISCAILITLWNASLSWDSSYPSLPKNPNPTDPSQSRIEFNKDELLKEWIKNQTISVGLLGIRISQTDLAVIGTGSLVVAMTWFFFCIRRENRAIVTLLQDIHEDYKKGRVSRDVCRMVYYGIVQSIIFIDMGGGDDPEGGIKRGAVTRAYIKKYSIKYVIKNLRIRLVMRHIFFLPPLAIFLVTILDLKSLFQSSPIRECQEALVKCLWHGTDPYLDIGKIVVFELAALLGIYYIWRICNICREFSRITGATIEEFGVKYDFYRKDKEPTD